MLTKPNKHDIIFPLVREADFLCQDSPLVCVGKQTVSLTNRRTRAFLLEEDMKVCYKCKQEKSLSEFRQYKSGVNKGYYNSYCGVCSELQKKEYYKKSPWAKTLSRILSRCNNKDNRYHKKGIKNYLSVADLKFIWFRDKAYLLDRPSIHRKDNGGHYTIDNSEFIELLENISLGCSGLSKQVKQLTPDGKLIKIWRSGTIAERALGLSGSRVSFVCNGFGNTAGGYKWEFNR